MSQSTNVDVILNAKDNASKVIRGVGDSAKDTGASASAAFQQGGIAATGFLAAITGLGVAMAHVAGNFEQNRVAFEVMTGSVERGRKAIADLSDFAARTPFELPQLMQASKSLLAYGIQSEELIPTLRNLGDIASGVGMDKLPNLILAFGQVKAATKLTGMELRQFTETGVPMLDMLGKQLGKTAGEIKEMITEGEISFDMVNKALQDATSEGGRFFQMMEKQSKTFGGVMSNIKDQITRSLAEIAGVDIAAGGLIREGSVFAVMKQLAEGFLQALNKATPVVVKFFAELMKNQTALTALGGAVLGAVILAIGAFVVAFGGAILILAGFMAAGAALAVVVRFLSKHIELAIGILAGIGAVVGAIVIPMFVAWAAAAIPAAVATLAAAAPFILLGLAVAAVVTVIALVITHFKDIVAWATTMAGVIGGALSTAFKNFQTAVSGVWTSITTFFSGLGSTISTALSNMGSAIATFISSVPSRISAGLQAVQTAFYNLFIIQIPYALGFMYGVLLRFFTVTIPAAWTALVNFFLVQVPMFTVQFVTWIGQMVTNAWLAIYNFTAVTVPQAFLGMINWLAVNIPIMANNFVMWLVEMANASWRAILKMKSDMIAAFFQLVQNVISAVVNLYNQVVSWFQNTVSSATAAVNALPGNIAAAFNNAKAIAVGKAQEIYNGVKAWFDRIIGMFGDIIGKAGEAIGKASEAFRLGAKAGAGKATGGIVPGPIGSPQLALVHGGEKIVPHTADTDSGGIGGGSTVFNVYVGMYAGSEIEKRNIAEMLYKQLSTVASSQNKSVEEMFGRGTI